MPEKGIGGLLIRLPLFIPGRTTDKAHIQLGPGEFLPGTQLSTTAGKKKGGVLEAYWVWGLQFKAPPPFQSQGDLEPNLPRRAVGRIKRWGEGHTPIPGQKSQTKETECRKLAQKPDLAAILHGDT